jgi:hypothetical protein
LVPFHWYIKAHEQTIYARALVGDRQRYMHRVVMGESPGYRYVIDHINGRGYDNRRENLRWVTLRENARNVHACEWHMVERSRSEVGRWCYRGPAGLVGSFETAFDAALAFDRAAIALGRPDLCHFTLPEAGEYRREYADLPELGGEA